MVVLGAHGAGRCRSASGLNGAIRQELRYVDTVVGSPFRMIRRALDARGGRSPMAREARELLEALEGMARLPVHVLQGAFGDNAESSHPFSQRPAPHHARRGHLERGDGSGREAHGSRDSDQAH